MASTSRPVHHVPNVELYDRWAEVYDTDGNILQALDDQCLPPLLEKAFRLCSSATGESGSISISELGCGTGRNTIKLLEPAITSTSRVKISNIHALDLSPGMLEIARTRCTEQISTSSSTTPNLTHPSVTFHIFDAFHPPATLPPPADLLLSTLVLEHLPLTTFFSTAARLLKPGGVLVLTNMHAEMGRRSQAGFVDERTGAKVRGQSWVYEVREVVDAARESGFVGMVGDGDGNGDGDGDGEAVVERAVRREDVEGAGENGGGAILGERGWKWVGVKCWFGLVLRLERDC